MPSPLGHITGLLFGIILPILTDGRVVLLDRWNPAEAVVQVESHACSFSVGATPFLSGLVKEYSLRGQQSALEWFVCGGADVPSDLVSKAKETMGTNVARAYGLTEMPTLCCASPSMPLELRESTDGEVIGEADARLGSGTGGLQELQVHGPELFLGYLDPSDNERAFTPDGWFRTGDLARLDGRYVTIVGRAKDVIVRGGENISAKEVEDLIRCMDSVSDVAIVGVADSELGERACAVIVPIDRAPALSDVTEHLVASGVAKQKCPEYLIVESSLPVTPSGKVRKFELRDIAAQRLAEGGIACHD
jgi:cyclohexanecarboxylate-CoA ligase